MTEAEDLVRDVYASVSSLLEVEAPHVEIQSRVAQRSTIAIIAPHAGRIEPATGELARAIAGDDHRLYCFSGRARENNHRLHVTSTKFVESVLEVVLNGAVAIVTVHGCRQPDVPVTLLGGANRDLRGDLGVALMDSGFDIDLARAPMAGIHPRNVTNRALAGGVQLEISRSQRDRLLEQRSCASGVHHPECGCGFCRYVTAIRSVLARYKVIGSSIPWTERTAEASGRSLSRAG